MNLPRFNAEASLGRGRSIYRGNAIYGGSGGIEILPMLAKECGNCEVVGRFGGIRGVGRRSCCQDQWIWNPITHRLEKSTTCWFESCSPEVLSNPWLSF